LKCRIPRDQNLNAIYRTDPGRIASSICSLLNGATRTALLFLVSRTAVLRPWKNAGRKKYMRSPQKNCHCQSVHAANCGKQPVDYITESKSDDGSHHGVPVSQELVPVILQKLGCSRLEEPSFMHGYIASKSQRQRSSNAANGMKNRYVGWFFQLMGLSSDETARAYAGIRGAGSSLYLRSISKRATTTSTSALAALNSFGDLSFAPRESSYNSTNHFVESLKTFPSRLATAFSSTTWYSTILLAYNRLMKLSEKN